MPRFRYTATGLDGEPVSGTIEAADLSAAHDVLLMRGLQPDRIEATDDDGPDGRGDVPREVRLSSMEQAEVFAQVGGLVEAGLPVSVGLRVLAEEFPAVRLRQAFLQMSNQLEAGEALPDVLNVHAGLLPRWLAQAMRAGVDGEGLSATMQHYVTFARARTRIRRVLMFCTIYPVVVIAVAMGLILALSVWLVPEFKKIFEGFGVELPAMTNLVIEISDAAVALVRAWWLSLPVLGLALTGLWIMARSVMGNSPPWRALRFVPLLNRMLKYSSLSEFCNLLAIMVECRMPLAEGLCLAGDGVADTSLRKSAARAAAYLEKGESPARLRFLVPELPVELARIPGWDATDGQFPEALRSSAAIFQAQTEISGWALAGILSPMVVIVTGAIVAMIPVAMFMPLIKLLNDLS